MKRTIALAVSAAIMLTLCSASSAQEEELVAECIQARMEKFGPLELETRQMYSKFGAKTIAIRECIRWLQEDPGLAENTRLAEIEEAEARLEVLKSLASLTSGDAIKTEAIEKTIEDANVMIEDINDDRALAIRPLERKQAALRREYKDQADKLETVMEGLFVEQGTGDLTSELKRSYASFTYGAGRASAQYKRGDNSSIACSLSILLVPDKKLQKDLGKVSDQYPLLRKSSNEIEFLVNGALVSIYSSDSKLNRDNLAKVVVDLIDMEALKSLMK